MSIKRKKIRKNKLHSFSSHFIIGKRHSWLRKGREEGRQSVCSGKLYTMAVQKCTFILLVPQSIVLIKMSKMPKGLLCAEWTMSCLCKEWLGWHKLLARWWDTQSVNYPVNSRPHCSCDPWRNYLHDWLTDDDWHPHTINSLAAATNEGHPYFFNLQYRYAVISVPVSLHKVNTIKLLSGSQSCEI